MHQERPFGKIPTHRRRNPILQGYIGRHIPIGLIGNEKKSNLPNGAAIAQKYNHQIKRHGTFPTSIHKIRGRPDVARLSKTMVEGHIILKSGGETGIRTLGTQAHNGFRDRPVRPLRHLSADRVAEAHHLQAARRLNESIPPCKAQRRPAKGLKSQVKNAQGGVDKVGEGAIFPASFRGRRRITGVA